MDIRVSGKGNGWFRAERIAFTKIPKSPTSLSIWKYERGTLRTACQAVLVDNFITEGEGKFSYGYVPSQDWPGLSGGWFVELASDRNGNDTLAKPPPGIAFPNIIRDAGNDYSDGKLGNGVYFDPTGGVIRAVPLWRKSGCPKRVSALASDA